LCEVKKVDQKKEILFLQNLPQIIPTNRPLQIDQETPSDDLILSGPTFYSTKTGIENHIFKDLFLDPNAKLIRLFNVLLNLWQQN